MFNVQSKFTLLKVHRSSHCGGFTTRPERVTRSIREFLGLTQLLWIVVCHDKCVALTCIHPLSVAIFAGWYLVHWV